MPASREDLQTFAALVEQLKRADPKLSLEAAGELAKERDPQLWSRISGHPVPVPTVDWDAKMRDVGRTIVAKMFQDWRKEREAKEAEYQERRGAAEKRVADANAALAAGQAKLAEANKRAAWSRDEVLLRAAAVEDFSDDNARRVLGVPYIVAVPRTPEERRSGPPYKAITRDEAVKRLRAQAEEQREQYPGYFDGPDAA